MTITILWLYIRMPYCLVYTSEYYKVICARGANRKFFTWRVKPLHLRSLPSAYYFYSILFSHFYFWFEVKLCYSEGNPTFCRPMAFLSGKHLLTFAFSTKSKCSLVPKPVGAHKYITQYLFNNTHKNVAMYQNYTNVSNRFKFVSSTIGNWQWRTRGEMTPVH